jgi:hypothetical protein
MLQCMEILAFKAPFIPRQVAARQYPLQFLCGFAYSVLDNKRGDLLEYPHLMKHPKYKDGWKSFGTEIRCLATTTETIFFIKKDEIPQERKGDETYAQIVCVYRNGKKDKYRKCISIGRNLVNYLGDCRTPTADLITVNLLLNSIISMPHSKFMTLNLKDFYHMTPMKCYEYFHMKIKLFPQDDIDQYNLTNKVDHNGNVHCKFRCSMYGLPQAGIIPQELQEEHLFSAGYSQSKLTQEYWKHEWRLISFTLVVDDFGLKYIGKEHFMHLIKTLKEHYKVEEDWEGKWSHVHARLRRMPPSTILSPHSNKAPTPTTPTCNLYIWSHTTARKTRRHIEMPLTRQEKIIFSSTMEGPLTPLCLLRV